MNREPQKVNILLVDDEPRSLTALESVLGSADRNLVKARSGEEALKCLLADDFAVILLDVQMPGLDGFETAALIRAREKSRHTPIIFLTAASRGDTHVSRGYSLGAVDYLFKPFVPEVLQSKVAVFVELARKTEQVKQQAALLRQKNEELERQNRRVQEATRHKSEFLASMSHELRTPLNAIIGFGELVQAGKAGPVSAEQQEYLGDILTSARHLLHIVNDVLDLARVEAGKIEFRPEPVDLGGLVGEVAEVVRNLAIQKQIRIETHVDRSLGDVVVDPAKLKQVLYNYLSNAIKFTPDEGRVMVRIGPEGPAHFRLEVEDTGIGIQPADLPRLFVEFQQLDAGAAKKYQGSGLGLALTRRIVEAQGGTVGVRSTPGAGSTFAAVLPRVATALSGASAKSSGTP